MASFEGILSGLRRAERELEAQLAGVRAALSSLIGSAAGTGRRGRPKGSKNKIIIVGGRPKRKRRKLSAATIEKMRKSQRARWARKKAADKKA